MKWTLESVTEFVELYTRKEITCDSKHPMHFNKIPKKKKMHGRKWGKK